MKIYHRYIGYIKNYGPWLSVPKGNDKSEILFAKIFSLKQKQIKCFQLLYKKSNFDSLKKVYGSFRQGITMEKCKTKAIQANLGIFTHIRAYSGIFRAYSRIFRTLCNPDIFRTLVYSESEEYSEPWCIQIPDIFKTLAYSEPCQTWSVVVKIVNGYNYFYVSFSRSIYFMKKIFFNTDLICILEVFIQCKVWDPREPGNDGR